MKVELLSSNYGSYGYYMGHIYEVIGESEMKFRLSRKDNQTPCWVLKEDCKVS